MAPGELPSAAHPAGTVFVALAEAPNWNVTVSEWDLASGHELRQGTVPVPPDNASVWMVRAGDRLHLLAWQYNNDIRYACMSTTDLTPLHAERLGTVSVAGPSAIASDGKLAIVLVDGILGEDPNKWPSGQEGYFALTYDANGRRIAARVLEKSGWDTHDPSGFMKQNAAVVDGRPYVLLATSDENRFRLLRMRRDLSVEHETALRVAGALVDSEYMSLDAWQDRLVVDATMNPPARVLSSLAPKELSRGAPCPPAAPPQGDPGGPYREVWLGRVHAVLHRGDSGKFRVAWSEADAAGPPQPTLCGPVPWSAPTASP